MYKSAVALPKNTFCTFIFLLQVMNHQRSFLTLFLYSIISTQGYQMKLVPQDPVPKILQSQELTIKTSNSLSPGESPTTAVCTRQESCSHKSITTWSEHAAPLSAEVPQKCLWSRSSTLDLPICCHHREKIMFYLSHTRNLVWGCTQILMFNCSGKCLASTSQFSSFQEKQAAGPFTSFQILFCSLCLSLLMYWLKSTCCREAFQLPGRTRLGKNPKTTNLEKVPMNTSRIRKWLLHRWLLKPQNTLGMTG